MYVCVSVLCARPLAGSSSALPVPPKRGAGAQLRLRYFPAEASSSVPQRAAPWRAASSAEPASSPQSFPRREPADPPAKPPGPSKPPSPGGTSEGEPIGSPSPRRVRPGSARLLSSGVELVPHREAFSPSFPTSASPQGIPTASAVGPESALSCCRDWT